MTQSTEKTNKTILYGLLFVTLIIVSLPAISTTLFYQAPRDTLFHTQNPVVCSPAWDTGITVTDEPGNQQRGDVIVEKVMYYPVPELRSKHFPHFGIADDETGRCAGTVSS